MSAATQVASTLSQRRKRASASPSTLAKVARAVGHPYLDLYHRWDLSIEAALPDEPAMLVCNHGFGGIIDLNVLTMAAALDRAGCNRPVTSLVHEIAWRLGAGRFVEALGGVPGSPAAVHEAIGRGHHVVVFPGGDLDAAKPFGRRNDVAFEGRSGFARLALELGLPVVPIVTAGAGESLLVLTSGEHLARRLGLQRLRQHVLPVSVSVPWGLSVGLVGLLPYMPLPTKLRTSVLAELRPVPGETAEAFAQRVETQMQRRLNELVEGRRMVLG